MTMGTSQQVSRPSHGTIILAIIAILLALNLLTTHDDRAQAQQPSLRTAVGITVVPHPKGGVPNVYRLWSDGTVEYSVGTERRREPWKRIPN